MKLVLVSLLLAATACGDDDGSASGAGGTVTVFAAASLTDAMVEVGNAFEDTRPAVTVELNFGPSSGLREQILAGAPADVYASADQSNMDRLVDAGFATEPSTFVTNRLEIAVAPGNPAGITGLEDFADEDLFLGLCAEAVPCGSLARRALANAGVEPSLDTNATDVRALLTQIASGDLDAGIVYRTDVASAGDDVDGVEIADDVNVTAEYPIARLADSDDAGIADEFVEFVLSDEGQEILASFGFGTR